MQTARTPQTRLLPAAMSNVDYAELFKCLIKIWLAPANRRLKNTNENLEAVFQNFF